MHHFRHDLAGARGRCQLHGLHDPDADARYAGERTAPLWRSAFKPTSWKRKAPAPALPPGADAQLVARMAAALAGITSQAWPPAVLATLAGALAGSASEAGHGLAA